MGFSCGPANTLKTINNIYTICSGIFKTICYNCLEYATRTVRKNPCRYNCVSQETYCKKYDSVSRKEHFKTQCMADQTGYNMNVNLKWSTKLLSPLNRWRAFVNTLKGKDYCKAMGERGTLGVRERMGS